MKEKTPKPKTNVAKSKSPEGSPKKSLAQKLVIKMKFATPPKGDKVSKLTRRRSSSSKAVKKKDETKGVKRKADKLAKPPSKRAKVAVKGKPEGKAVRKKMTLPKPKPNREKKAVQEEEPEDDENEEEAIEAEEGEEEEENIAEGEAQSDSEDEVEEDNEGNYDDQVDASDYRYSLEEEAINQVDDSDEEEEEDMEEDEEEEEEEDENDDVDIEQYERESPFVDQVKYENVEEAHNVGNTEILEADRPDIVIGESNDTDNDSAVEESVDTAQCFPESGEETNLSSADENNDRDKVERLLNRTEGMTVQDAYETSVRLGHFSDLQAQRRSPRATPSRFGNSARRNSYEKSRSFSDSYEWEPIQTRRKSQTFESSKDVNENNNIVIPQLTEPLRKSVSESKVLETNNTVESLASKSETVQNVKQSPKLKRKASLGTKALETNIKTEAPSVKTETVQNVEQSPRPKRKASLGTKALETNIKTESPAVKTETVQNVKQSPRPKRKASLGTKALETNIKTESPAVKTETVQNVEQSPRPKRKASLGNKSLETYDIKETPDTKIETVQNIERSPRPKRKASLETVSKTEQVKRRQSSDIKKSPARSPRARTVSEPAPSPRVEIPATVESTEDDRYGPDGENGTFPKFLDILKIYHYANMLMHYAEIFNGYKNDNF